MGAVEMRCMMSVGVIDRCGLRRLCWVLAAAVAAGVPLGGCAGWQSWPPREDEPARLSPNSAVALDVMEASLRWAIDRRPPKDHQGPVALNLPVGLTEGAYRGVARDVGRGSVPLSTRTQDLPIYHISSFRVRMSEAQVELLRPALPAEAYTEELRTDPLAYEGYILTLKGGLGGWRVELFRERSPGVIPVPELNFIDVPRTPAPAEDPVEEGEDGEATGEGCSRGGQQGPGNRHRRLTRWTARFRILPMATATPPTSPPTNSTPAANPTHTFRRSCLLQLRGMSAEEIRALLRAAAAWDRGREDHPLAGQTICNLFAEDSTRTRTSFTLAARRLGADVVEGASAGSSLSKGESLVDTARTIQAMGVQAFVVRSRQTGGAHAVARATGAVVINAGDGRHEHPTQGLLDCYSLWKAVEGRRQGERQGTKTLTSEQVSGTGQKAPTSEQVEFDLGGVRVVIVGDVIRSRVARSAAWGMRALGAQVTLCGPAGAAPASLGRALGCAVASELDPLLGEADAVMALRIQKERGGLGPVGSLREYRERFALTSARAERMKAGAVIMHPGPTNRGVEIDAEVADGPRSIILQQVAAGVPVRMGALELCLAASLRP
jgi:aspartate carbamoyltransferase catalytic subunit